MKKNIFKKNMKNKLNKLKERPAGVYSNVPKIVEIDLDKIEFSPNQPRIDYNEDKINELAKSIKNQGLIQPITVQKLDNDKYQILAGHRRFIAFKQLNKESIPAIIRDNLSNEELITLSENLIRENLNPLEIAISLESILLNNSTVKTQAELAKILGINESTVSRYLKLLKLPAKIKDYIKEKKYTDLNVLNKLSTIPESDALIIFEKIIDKNLNRKEALDLINNYKNKGKEIIKGNGYKIEKTSRKMKIEIDPNKIKDPIILEALLNLEKHLIK